MTKCQLDRVENIQPETENKVFYFYIYRDLHISLNDYKLSLATTGCDHNIKGKLNDNLSVKLYNYLDRLLLVYSN